ncbi:3-oxoacyl-[acyl-carrier protein] reductase [Xaviernesmea oryzae]|uniref:3-oxoacyl-[acyl-carrier protein] reductase n=1 Tax=Xaviernesmea oryzae TaxID=464029 RepID=A0A1X7FNW8_9HYPH|nr:SDR family NAD(P)-dependent oxidoreductase [Xaviernesmea oryzae]SMF55995.1 3-oxoacyl-[acyl-carrier protein] reductase [Xaviernesmea oryzae]
MKDCTAIVTGGARGIGFAIAQRLLERGAKVLLVDILEDELSASLKSLPEQTRPGAAAFGADVSIESQVQAMVNFAAEYLGSPTILINNAGISPKRNGRKQALVEIELEEWRRVMDINLTSTFLCCQAILPTMFRLGWGRIVNISSQAGKTYTDIAGTHYAASKAGMLGLTRTLAREVGPRGVTVNAICPGRIESPMVAEAGLRSREDYIGRIPVGRLGTGHDVASAVEYLVSADAGFVTGHALDVNGGLFMA